ncbi:EpsG family protein [Arsenophonus sp. aPb]|uniref:EpsG family protein n=1 Tax=Arsenophonus sp. aPb TaxID=3041619 RepID=UPI002469011D|nr:EpsG family protein [Arsenophonus sp. aPb]WGL98420.1 EpsG family protein [Arsenophonus sp. aPb]
MIFSFFLYNSIVFLATFFAWLSERYKSKIFYIISFLIVFIPSAIRENIGGDYNGYVNYFNNIYSINYLEPVFTLLIKFIRLFSVNSQWLFAIVAFITYYLIWFLAAKFRKKYIIILSYLLILYLSSYSGIKLGLALTLCLLGLYYLCINCKIKYIIFMLLAVGTHYSTFVIFIISFFYKIRLTYVKLIFIFIGLIVIAFLPMADIILNSPLLKLTQYSNYINSRFNSSVTISLLGYMSLLLIPFIILVNYFLEKYFLIQKQAQDFNFTNLSIILLIGFVFSVILSGEMYIFTRFRDLFSIYLIFCIMYITNFNLIKIKLNMFTVNVSYIICALQLLVFERSIYFATYYITTGLRINPYQTFLTHYFN